MNTPADALIHCPQSARPPIRSIASNAYGWDLILIELLLVVVIPATLAVIPFHLFGRARGKRPQDCLQLRAQIARFLYINEDIGQFA